VALFRHQLRLYSVPLVITFPPPGPQLSSLPTLHSSTFFHPPDLFTYFRGPPAALSPFLYFLACFRPTVSGGPRLLSPFTPPGLPRHFPFPDFPPREASYFPGGACPRLFRPGAPLVSACDGGRFFGFLRLSPLHVSRLSAFYFTYRGPPMRGGGGFRAFPPLPSPPFCFFPLSARSLSRGQGPPVYNFTFLSFLLTSRFLIAPVPHFVVYPYFMLCLLFGTFVIFVSFFFASVMFTLFCAARESSGCLVSTHFRGRAEPPLSGFFCSRCFYPRCVLISVYLLHASICGLPLRALLSFFPPPPGVRPIPGRDAAPTFYISLILLYFTYFSRRVFPVLSSTFPDIIFLSTFPHAALSRSRGRTVSISTFKLLLLLFTRLPALRSHFFF
jgi:hypothetical protein